MEDFEIKARMVVEALGTPKETLSRALKAIIGGIEDRKDVEVTKKEIAKPEKIKNSFLYSGFIEFECKVKDFQTLLGLILDFLPSVVEIIEPDSISMPSVELQPILNDLISKLKRYDNNIKALIAKTVILEKKLKGKNKR